MYHKLETTELDRLIKKSYGVDFNSAYEWTQGEKLEICGISPIVAESDEWCKKNLKEDSLDSSQPPLYETIMCDLCAKGKLKKGDYFLVFDD